MIFSFFFFLCLGSPSLSPHTNPVPLLFVLPVPNPALPQRILALLPGDAPSDQHLLFPRSGSSSPSFCFCSVAKHAHTFSPRYALASLTQFPGSSSLRYKYDVEEMPSDGILQRVVQLQGVTFRKYVGMLLFRPFLFSTMYVPVMMTTLPLSMSFRTTPHEKGSPDSLPRTRRICSRWRCSVTSRGARIRSPTST